MAKSTQMEMLIGGRVAGSLMRSYDQAKAGAEAVGKSANASFARTELSAARAGSAVGKMFAFSERRQAKLAARMEKAQAGAALTGQVIKYRGSLEKLQANQVRFGRSTEAIVRATRTVGRQLPPGPSGRPGTYGVDLKKVGRSHRAYVKEIEKTERAMKTAGRAPGPGPEGPGETGRPGPPGGGPD